VFTRDEIMATDRKRIVIYIDSELYVNFELIYKLWVLKRTKRQLKSSVSKFFVNMLSEYIRREIIVLVEESKKGGKILQG
jgi:hypothetical protein